MTERKMQKEREIQEIDLKKLSCRKVNGAHVINRNKEKCCCGGFSRPLGEEEMEKNYDKSYISHPRNFNNQCGKSTKYLMESIVN